MTGPVPSEAWGNVTKLWSMEQGICYRAEPTCADQSEGPMCQDVGAFELTALSTERDEITIAAPIATIAAGERPYCSVEPTPSGSLTCDIEAPEDEAIGLMVTANAATACGGASALIGGRRAGRRAVRVALTSCSLESRRAPLRTPSAPPFVPAVNGTHANYRVDSTPLAGTRRVFAATRVGDQVRLLLKRARAGYPAAEEAARLRHEFAVLSRLKGAPVAEARDFIEDPIAALVMAVAPGRSVDAHIAEGLPDASALSRTQRR